VQLLQAKVAAVTDRVTRLLGIPDAELLDILQRLGPDAAHAYVIGRAVAEIDILKREHKRLEKEVMKLKAKINQ